MVPVSCAGQLSGTGPWGEIGYPVPWVRPLSGYPGQSLEPSLMSPGHQLGSGPSGGAGCPGLVSLLTGYPPGRRPQIDPEAAPSRPRIGPKSSPTRPNIGFKSVSNRAEISLGGAWGWSWGLLGSPGGSWKAPGGLPGRPGGLLGASWEPPGGLGGSLGASWGGPGRTLGPSGGVPGAPGESQGDL